jgi:hypothetical protein
VGRANACPDLLSPPPRRAFAHPLVALTGRELASAESHRRDERPTILPTDPEVCPTSASRHKRTSTPRRQGELHRLIKKSTTEPFSRLLVVERVRNQRRRDKARKYSDAGQLAQNLNRFFGRSLMA